MFFAVSVRPGNCMKDMKSAECGTDREKDEPVRNWDDSSRCQDFTKGKMCCIMNKTDRINSADDKLVFTVFKHLTLLP